MIIKDLEKGSKDTKMSRGKKNNKRIKERKKG